MTLFFFLSECVELNEWENPRNTYKFVFIRQVIPCLTRLQKFSRNIVRNWVRINFFVNLCHLFCRSMDYYRSFSIKTLYSLSQILKFNAFSIESTFYGNNKNDLYALYHYRWCQGSCFHKWWGYPPDFVRRHHDHEARCCPL